MLKNCQRSFDCVRRELFHAYQRTSFFPEHLAKSGLTLAHIRTSDDFARIRPTEKRHYRKGFPSRVVASGFTIDDPQLYRSYSSGTTGERLLTLESPLVYSRRVVECLTANPRFLPLFHQHRRRHLRYAAPNCSDVVCADPYKNSARDRLLGDGTLVLSGRHDLMTTPPELLISSLVEIEQFKPHLYYVDPTHFAFLARFIARHRFKPYAVPVVTTFSLSTRVGRRLIAEAFGDAHPVIDVVSMSELGWLAVECPLGKTHLNNLSYYVELLSGGGPSRGGQLSELYVTTLDNGCTPRIRYRTGDVFRLVEEECECGCEFPVVRIEGRLSDCIFRGGEILLTPRELDDIVGDPEWLDFYKLHQVDEFSFHFTYIVNKKYAASDESCVVEKIRGALGGVGRLETQRSDYIRCEDSGKFAPCSSEVGRTLTQNGVKL